MLRVTYPGSGNQSDFTYGPTGECVKIVETVASSVVSTKQFIRSGSRILEERDRSGSLSNGKQFFPLGQVDFSSGSPSNHFYTQDHPGSMREVTDGSGSIVGQYTYGPFGEVSKIQGSGDSDFGYAGYFKHKSSDLNLTLFRAYSPKLGRWINRDPIGEAGGLNLYGYVGNRPTMFIDPMGLDWQLVIGWKPVPVLPGKLGYKHGDLFLVHNGTVVGSWSGQLRGTWTGGSLALTTKKGQGAFDASMKQEVASGSDDSLCETQQKLNDASNNLGLPWLGAYELGGPNSNSVLYNLLESAGYTPPKPMAGVNAPGYSGYPGPFHQIYMPLEGTMLGY